MNSRKLQRIVIVALMVVGLGASTFALWPGPPEEVPDPGSQADLLRKVQPSTQQSWSVKWPDANLAAILSSQPLYGSFLDFYTVEAVEEGLVGVVLLSLPEHASPGRVWLACLLDADLLIFRALELQADLQGVYVIAGLELDNCQDGCSDHFFDLWGVYLTREQAIKDGPRGWRIISEDIWWDPYFFDPGREDN